MDQIAELLEGYIGERINIYVMGSYSSAVGGRISRVSEQYVELDQEESLLAYIPIERIVFFTIQKHDK